MNHLRIQEIYGKIETGFPKIITDLKEQMDGIYTFQWTDKYKVTFYCNGKKHTTFNFEHILNELLNVVVEREKGKENKR